MITYSVSEFKEVRKSVGEDLTKKSIFERLELLRQNASFLPKQNPQNSHGIIIRKVVGGSH